MSVFDCHSERSKAFRKRLKKYRMTQSMSGKGNGYDNAVTIAFAWFAVITKKPPYLEAFFIVGAGNETRTRDPNLGKVVLYQLSYSRIWSSGLSIGKKLFSCKRSVNFLRLFGGFSRGEPVFLPGSP